MWKQNIIVLVLLLSLASAETTFFDNPDDFFLMSGNSTYNSINNTSGVAGAGSSPNVEEVTTAIEMNDFNITYDKIWTKKSINRIYVDVYDINWSYTNVDNVVFIPLIENASIYAKQLTNVSIGRYYKDFIVYDYTGNITLVVEVIQSSKILEKQITIEIKDISILDSMKDFFNSMLYNGYTLFILGLLILIIIFVIIMNRKGGRN